MQFEIIKRFTAGWTFQGNYTWSKALGEEDGDGQELNDSYRDLRNWRLDKRLLDFHRMHVIRTNALFELPFGPGKKLLSSSHAVVSRLIGGWQMGSIFNIFSGAPISVTSGASTYNNFGDNTAMAFSAVGKDFGEAVREGNGVTYFSGIRQMVDPSVALLTTAGNIQSRSTLRAIADATGRVLFANPTPGILGNLAPRFLTGPGSFRLDLNLLKTIRIAEGKNAQLSMILQDATNSPQFNNPNTDINSLNFGRITGAGGNRIVVIGARINF